VDADQRKWFSGVVMAQQYEYVTASAIDKALESLLGFVSVLPGAFSAYRWEALQGDPLHAYFKMQDRGRDDGAVSLGSMLTPSEANMYLAEDRILGALARRVCCNNNNGGGPHSG
jgi:chitin synthase